MAAEFPRAKWRAARFGLARCSRVVAIVAALAVPTLASAQKKLERRAALGMEGAIRISNMVGSVVVHGWNKDTVLVRGALAPGDQLFMGGGYTGTKMFVESANERDPKPTRLEVWVPAKVRLWIKTATASIEVSGVEGGLDLYVVSGAIDVNGTPRELNAEAIDGDIHIAGSSPWIRAKSASGTVTFQGSSADGVFSTVSGAIRIGGGAYERLKVETVTGDIGFTGRLDRGGVFDFDSHSGAIDLAIPDKTEASFSVVSVAGKINNALSRTIPVSGRFGRGAELTMDSGGGGARVSVRTFKGSVTLRRAK